MDIKTTIGGTDATSVLKEFFERNTLDEHKEKLWEIFTAAVNGNTEGYYDGQEVGDWAMYIRSLEKFLEATSTVHEH